MANRTPGDRATVVWDIVALACLSALEVGRRLLFQGGRVTRSRADLTRICTSVTLDFWARLSDFAELGLPPRHWALVPHQHPFLHRAPDDSIVAVLPTTVPTA